MSRILFAWELGGGYGHLGPFFPIARSLMARGHEVTIAARDVERATIVFGPTQARVVQAPLCLKNYAGLEDPPLNYAEILMRYGYVDAPMLGGLVRGWRDVIALVRPDVLVADHAPTALLAARGMPVRKVVMGSPFTVPPRMNPTPNMRAWLSVPHQRLESSDKAVLAAANASLPKGAPALTTLCELFDGADILLNGVAELDPNGPRDPGNYLGLYSGVIGTQELSWPAGDAPRIYAYLTGEYRHLEAALAALAGCGARCLVVAVGMLGALRQKYGGGNLVFSPALVDLRLALSQCDLCVCHGNFGTVNEALRLGRPVVVLPMDLEKFLLANALRKLNVARFVNPDAPQPDFAGVIRQALSDSSMLDAARAFAARHREPAVDTIVERAASRIDALARTQGQPG